MALPYRWQWRVERWKNSMRGFFGGEQPPRPKICPACGALVGISATRCHECGASLRFSLAALSKGLSRILGDHEAPVTSALLIANFMMLGVSWLAYSAVGKGGGFTILWGLVGEPQYRLGASYGPPIFYGNEWWRLVTAMFLHGGLIHIGFNMMSLMQLGPALEELYGSARYLFLYVVTGAFGFLVSAFTGHFSVGASGALLGLVGVMLAITTKRGGAYMHDLRSCTITIPRRFRSRLSSPELASAYPPFRQLITYQTPVPVLCRGIEIAPSLWIPAQSSSSACTPPRKKCGASCCPSTRPESRCAASI